MMTRRRSKFAGTKYMSNFRRYHDFIILVPTKTRKSTVVVRDMLMNHRIPHIFRYGNIMVKSKDKKSALVLANISPGEMSVCCKFFEKSKSFCVVKKVKIFDKNGSWLCCYGCKFFRIKKISKK